MAGFFGGKEGGKWRGKGRIGGGRIGITCKKTKTKKNTAFNSRGCFPIPPPSFPLLQCLGTKMLHDWKNHLYLRLEQPTFPCSTKKRQHFTTVKPTCLFFTWGSSLSLFPFPHSLSFSLSPSLFLALLTSTPLALTLASAKNSPATWQLNNYYHTLSRDILHDSCGVSLPFPLFRTRACFLLLFSFPLLPLGLVSHQSKNRKGCLQTNSVNVILLFFFWIFL